MPNRKIILSILIIGTVAAVACTETWAFFADTTTSTGNGITVGTLHLTTDPDTSYMTIEGVSAGSSDTLYQTITNSGTVPGKLRIDFGNIQESVAAEVPSKTTGKDDLLHSVRVNVKLVKASDGTLVKQLTGSESTLVPIISCRELSVSNIPMYTNTAYKLVVYYEIPPNTDGGIQGKKLTFGVTYTLST
jgi:hypothetical protein